MKTLSYLFDLTPALAAEIELIENRFICFANYDMVGDYLEVTLRCRIEDVASIERRLAEFC